MNVQPIRPQAAREPDGRISVFIGGAHKLLPHEAAASLFEQLAVALRAPYSEGVAMFAAKVLQCHRPSPGAVGDVDGGELQELALAHGLLESFERQAESCGEHCLCEEGDRCLRYTPLARSLMELIGDADDVAEVTL